MNILEKLKQITHKEPELKTFCIQTIRFKQFLENARALLDIFEDGREKYLGEYIFDRHYVLSLIDRVIEKLGMMVYDACVLIPQNGKELYATYDKHKIVAENLISGSGYLEEFGIPGDFTSATSAIGTSDLYDTEYQLLLNVLRWFNVKDAPSNATVMNFMKYLFFNVTQGLEAMETMKNRALFEKSGLKATDMGIYLVDLWQDAFMLPEARRSINDVKCIPLKHMLMKTGKRASENADNSVNWVAAVSEHQLSLNTLKPDLQLRLETLAGSDEKSNFIFIFADKSLSMETIIPAGFNIEYTDYGQFAWNICISAETIEEILTIIGRNLFN